MPLYNVEGCLKEAVDSVVNQSIGFKDNIQIIFVNDGSSDGTDDMCTQNKEKYPENITYVSKPNVGVSSVRNCAMRYINGRYTVFVGQLLEREKVKVRVLKTDTAWCGITYKKDIPEVKYRFREMIRQKKYKIGLFSYL